VAVAPVQMTPVPQLVPSAIGVHADVESVGVHTWQLLAFVVPDA
jgi:hypothetical protein